MRHDSGLPPRLTRSQGSKHSQMANENEARIHAPSPTATRGGGTDRVHISVPRPLPRSISWVPTDIPAEDGNEPVYDVFITQAALGQLLDHVRESTPDGRPLGL